MMANADKVAAEANAAAIAEDVGIVQGASADALGIGAGAAETLDGDTNDLCGMGARTSRSGKIKVHPLIVRAVASLFRNIPVVAWAFILLFSFKQSEFTGFFALFLTSFGYLTRCFLESIDEMSAGPVEALRASGATYGQIVAQAVVPMSITSVISWVMYMIETNIRDATLIGLLTGTGIGFVFDVYYKSFRYDIAGLVILSIVLVVIACELTSNFVRRKVI